MADNEVRPINPELIAAIDETVQIVMAHRVREGHLPAAGPAFDDERTRLSIELLSVLLRA